MTTAVTIYLLALNDGTDEIFNIGALEIAVTPEETFAQAFERYLTEEYKKCWDPETNNGALSFGDTPEENAAGYREWMENRFYALSLFSLGAVADAQNATTEKFVDESAFLPLDDAKKVGQGLVDLRRALQTAAPE